MVDFIVGHYNYWIVIILMMTGLYIVFSRSNLVKKIVGLNVFQTSVFIFYITIGKVAGGTAPIFIGDYGGGHGKDHGAGHGDNGHGDDGHGAFHGEAAEAGHGAATVHGEVDDKALNTLTEDFMAAFDKARDAHAEEVGALHAMDEMSGGLSETGRAKNDLANAFKDAFNTAQGKAPPSDGPLHSVEVAPAGVAGEHDAYVGDAASAVADIAYSNPLPHVLILTAIVVGVATTAVGLALAVRIREAYGTIEEDELQAADDETEFGIERAERAALRAAETAGSPA